MDIFIVSSLIITHSTSMNILMSFSARMWGLQLNVPLEVETLNPREYKSTSVDSTKQFSKVVPVSTFTRNMSVLVAPHACQHLMFSIF